MGIFDASANVFTTYAAEIKFRNWVMGGVPKDPKIVEGWLKSKAGITDKSELREALVRTLVELGEEIPNAATLTVEQLDEAISKIAGVKQTNGFKRNSAGLYLEGRQVKAMLKEVINILFAGERWGATRKGPISFSAERVFVDMDEISLGVEQPTSVHPFVGHIKDQAGRRATLTYVEYVKEPTIRFPVKVTFDAIESEKWPMIWVQAQEIGLGALRSQGYGRFDVLKWEKIA